jgi:hypothetical protein
VVHRVVADNLKPVVTRADRYAPTLDRVFLKRAQYCGLVVAPSLLFRVIGHTYFAIAVTSAAPPLGIALTSSRCPTVLRAGPVAHSAGYGDGHASVRGHIAGSGSFDHC